MDARLPQTASRDACERIAVVECSAILQLRRRTGLGCDEAHDCRARQQKLGNVDLFNDFKVIAIQAYNLPRRARE